MRSEIYSADTRSGRRSAETTNPMKRIVAIVAFTLTIGACGTDTGPLESDLALLADENVDLLESQEQLGRLAETRQEALSETTKERDAAIAELAELQDEHAVTSAELDSLLEDAELLQKQVEVSREDRDEAVEASRELRATVEILEGEIDDLRIAYDDELRADIQVRIDRLIEQECAQAIENYDRDISTLRFGFSADWETVQPKADVITAIEECAAPERAVLQADSVRADFSLNEELRMNDDWAEAYLDAGGERPTTSGERLALGERFCGDLRNRSGLAAFATTSNSASLAAQARLALCPDIEFSIVSGGTHTIGSNPDDIPAGSYRSKPGVSDCYWERTRSDGDIIQNDFVSFAAGGVVVNVAASDASVEFGCGKMVRFN